MLASVLVKSGRASFGAQRRVCRESCRQAAAAARNAPPAAARLARNALERPEESAGRIRRLMFAHLAAGFGAPSPVCRRRRSRLGGAANERKVSILNGLINCRQLGRPLRRTWPAAAAAAQAARARQRGATSINLAQAGNYGNGRSIAARAQCLIGRASRSETRNSRAPLCCCHAVAVGRRAANLLSLATCGACA